MRQQLGKKEDMEEFNLSERIKKNLEENVPLKEREKIILKESELQNRKQISYFMTFLSLVNLHIELVKSFKHQEGDYLDENKTKTIPSQYKGLIYRLIFLKTISLTRNSHYIYENSQGLGFLKKCFLRMAKLCGFNYTYKESHSTEGQYKGSDWPQVCPNIWNRFGIDPFGGYLKFSSEKKLIDKWKTW